MLEVISPLGWIMLTVTVTAWIVGLTLGWAEEFKGLAMPPGVPVIEVLHTSVDDKGRPFEVTRFVMRADINGLDYEMAVED